MKTDKDNELGCKWYFPSVENAHEVGENDALSDLFTGSAYQALIREALQNSMDAGPVNAGPVRVNFSMRFIEKERCKQLFKLSEHIQGCIKRCKETPEKPGKFLPMMKWLNEDIQLVPVLDISDYNTRGMTFEECEDEDGSTYYKGGFQAFVRSAGEHDGAIGTGGSHGYGKTTYFNVSGLRTLVVSTMTQNYECFFEGVSWLCSHRINGQQFLDWGFYDNHNGLPVRDSVRNLDHGVTKSVKIPELFRRDEPGTTVSLLCVDINPMNQVEIFEECCDAVMRNFFAAIDSGRLEVTIKLTESLNITFTKHNIADLIAERFDELDFTKRGKHLIDNFNPRPYLNAIKCAVPCVNETMTIEEAIDKCKGKPFVMIEDSLPILKKVKLFAFKTNGATDTIVFIRKPRMVVQAVQPTGAKKGYYGVFACEEEPGNDLLQRMEDASHKHWTRDKFDKRKQRENYDLAGQIEHEMNDFIDKCINILYPIKQTGEEDVAGLEDFALPILGDDDISDQSVGALINFKPDGAGELGSPNGSLIPPESKLKNEQQEQGVAQRTRMQKAMPGNGNLHGGNNGQPRKPKPKPQPRVRPGGNSEFEADDKAKEVTIRENVPVGYRIFIDVLSDKTVQYTLIVDSPEEIKDAFINFRPVGETSVKSSDIDLEIGKISPCGQARGNSIFGVDLVKGKNKFKFQVTDNKVYSLTLVVEHLKKISL